MATCFWTWQLLGWPGWLHSENAFQEHHVDTLCSFRVFIVPIDELGNDETQVTFNLCDFFPIRADDAIVRVDKTAAVRGKVYRL